MVVFFVILMLSTVNRQDSFHPRSFRIMSRQLAWLIIGLFVVEKMGIINFVAFEIIILCRLARGWRYINRRCNSLQNRAKHQRYTPPAR